MKIFNLFIFTLFFILNALAQDGGGPYLVEQGPCLSNEQRARIISHLKEVTKTHKSTFDDYLSRNKSGGSDQFIWPVAQTDNNDDPGYFGISNFVDHNLLTTGPTSSLLDYNCGSRTYDIGNYNHRGTDIFNWPFPWLKMDNDEVKVVAAKKGMIIYVSNGNHDRSCTFCNNCDWNAVYILQADGMVTWYGHLKRESIPRKLSVGIEVEQGEFLGIVGSSGSSTGPHLHFEVWDSKNYIYIVDPFKGNCNPITNSLWEDQRRYRISTVNLIETGYAPPVGNDCDIPWKPKLKEYFDKGDFICFSMYLTDELETNIYNLQIENESGDIIDSWQHISERTFNASYWFWNRTISNAYENGVYTFKVLHNNQVLEKEFYVGDITSTSSSLKLVNHLFYSANDRSLHLDNMLLQDYHSLLVTSIDGQELISQKIENNELTIPINYNGIVSVTLLSHSKKPLSTLVPIF